MSNVQCLFSFYHFLFTISTFHCHSDACNASLLHGNLSMSIFYFPITIFYFCPFTVTETHAMRLYCMIICQCLFFTFQLPFSIYFFCPFTATETHVRRPADVFTIITNVQCLMSNVQCPMSNVYFLFSFYYFL